MLVVANTFEAIFEASSEVDMAGTAVRIPSVLHLVSLKAHALGTGPPERAGKDYQDIVGLLHTQELDPRSPDVRSAIERHCSEHWYARILESFPAST